MTGCAFVPTLRPHLIEWDSCNAVAVQSVGLMLAVIWNSGCQLRPTEPSRRDCFIMLLPQLHWHLAEVGPTEIPLMQKEQSIVVCVSCYDARPMQRAHDGGGFIA